MQINELFYIQNNKIYKAEIIKQTKKYISVRTNYMSLDCFHKERQKYRIWLRYFLTYDDALNEIIKTIIEKKEEIIKLNNEINEIFSEYILEDSLYKFKWLLY